MEPFALRSIVALLQFKTIGGLIIGVGCTVFSATVAEAVEVQKLVVFVTVSVYVPPMFTTGLSVIPPETMPPVGDQLYVKFPPVELPVPFNVTVILVQSMLPGALATAVGSCVSPPMVTIAVEVQPVVVFVTKIV